MGGRWGMWSHPEPAAGWGRMATTLVAHMTQVNCCMLLPENSSRNHRRLGVGQLCRACAIQQLAHPKPPVVAATAAAAGVVAPATHTLRFSTAVQETGSTTTFGSALAPYPSTGTLPQAPLCPSLLLHMPAPLHSTPPGSPPPPRAPHPVLLGSACRACAASRPPGSCQSAAP